MRTHRHRISPNSVRQAPRSTSSVLLAVMVSLVVGCVANNDKDNASAVQSVRDISRFESTIDFDNGDFRAQLDSGWYELESDEDNSFRWIANHAVAYLKNNDSAQGVELSFYIPEIRYYRNDSLNLTMAVDGIEVFAQGYDSSGSSSAVAVLPKIVKSRPVLRIDISVDRRYEPPGSYDPRKLALIVDGLKLTSSVTAETNE